MGSRTQKAMTKWRRESKETFLAGARVYGSGAAREVVQEQEDRGVLKVSTFSALEYLVTYLHNHQLPLGAHRAPIAREIT